MLGKVIKQFKAHEGEIKNFTVSKDYSLMATAANDGCNSFTYIGR
jgi:hypothetical protein